MSTETDIQKIYVAYFNRPADDGGLDYWRGAIDGGRASLADLTAIFATTQEYRSLYAGSTSAAIVGTIYDNLFGRQPEPAGLAYWTGELDAGRLGIGTVAYTVLNAAGGDDERTIANKADAAVEFTKQLASRETPVAYSGAILDRARDWLSAVDEQPNAGKIAALTIDSVLGVPEHTSPPVTYTITIGQDPSNIPDNGSNPDSIADFRFGYDKIHVVNATGAPVTASNPALFYFEDFLLSGGPEHVDPAYRWKDAAFGALTFAHGDDRMSLDPLMAGETVLYAFESDGVLNTYLFVDDGASAGNGSGMDNGVGSAVWHTDADRVINLTGIIGLRLSPDGATVDGELFA